MKSKLYFLLLLNAKLFGQEQITNFDYQERDILAPIAYLGALGSFAVYEGRSYYSLLVSEKEVLQSPPLPGQVAMLVVNKEFYKIAQREKDVLIEKWKGGVVTVQDARFLTVFKENVYYTKEGYLWRTSVTDGRAERLLQGTYALAEVGEYGNKHQYLHGESGMVFEGGQIYPGQVSDIKDLVLHQKGVLLTVGQSFKQFWLEDEILTEVGTGKSGRKYYSRGDYFIEMDLNSATNITVSTLSREGKKVLIDTSVDTETRLITYIFMQGHVHVPYFEPQIIGDFLLFLGSASLQGYYSDGTDKALSLYQIHLPSGDLEKIHADLLVPGGTYYPLSPFRAEVLAGGKLRVLSSKDRVNAYVYDTENRAFSVHAQTAGELAQASPAFSKVSISLGKERWELWNDQGKNMGSLPYPVHRSSAPAVESISQDSVWISHRIDNEKVSVARFDGKTLRRYNTVVQSAHPLKISEGKTEDGKEHLIMLDNAANMHAFLLSGDSLVFLGSGEHTGEVGVAFSVKRINGQVLEVLRPDGSRWAIHNGKVHRTEKAFPEGYMVLRGQTLVYVAFDSGAETVLSKSIDDYFLGKDRLHWVDGKGYHSFNGEVRTHEKMLTTGYSPRISKTGSKYVVVQVNQKVILVDVEAGTEFESALPVEAILGNWYFVQDAYLYGVSPGTFKVYRYSPSKNQTTDLKKFSSSYRLEGNRRIWARTRQQSEIWEVVEGSVQLRFKFPGSSVEVMDRPQFSDDGLFIDIQQRKALPSPFMKEAQWLDSLKNVHYFSSEGRLWSWDIENLNKQDLGDFEGVFLREGGNVYYLQEGRIIRSQGYTKENVAQQSGKNLVYHEGYLYWIFEGQVWRAKQPEVLQVENQAHYRIYPNPAYERLYVKPSKPVDKQVPIRVFSAEGKLLLEELSTHEEGINVSKFPTGLYFIQIGGQTFRFIKAF